MHTSLHHSGAGGPTDATRARENQRGDERALCQPGAVPVPDRLLAAHLQGVPLQRRGLHRPHDHRGQSLPGVPPAGYVANGRCLQGVCGGFFCYEIKTICIFLFFNF